MVGTWSLVQNAFCFSDETDNSIPVDESFELWKAQMFCAEREFRFGQLEQGKSDMDTACTLAWKIKDKSKREYAILALNARLAYHKRDLETARRLYFKCLLLWTSNTWEGDQVVSGLLSEMAAVEFLFSNFDAAEHLLLAAIQIDETTVGKDHELCKDKQLDLFWLRSATCKIQQTKIL